MPVISNPKIARVDSKTAFIVAYDNTFQPSACIDNTDMAYLARRANMWQCLTMDSLGQDSHFVYLTVMGESGL